MGKRINIYVPEEAEEIFKEAMKMSRSKNLSRVVRRALKEYIRRENHLQKMEDRLPKKATIDDLYKALNRIDLILTEDMSPLRYSAGLKEYLRDDDGVRRVLVLVLESIQDWIEDMYSLIPSDKQAVDAEWEELAE